MYTVGHSTRSFDEFLASLRAWDIDGVIDVRTAAGSRRNPQYGERELTRRLSEAGIAYERMPELGGWRRARPDSVNAGWRNASFRGYADYMQTAEFRRAICALIAKAQHGNVAIMCAEAVPWRCHRSLIADALVARGCKVRHITSTTRAEPHHVTPFARIDGDAITYPEAL